MKKGKELCDERGARWGLKTEGGTDLWSEELLLYEIDLVNRSKVNRGSLDRIGSHTKPRTEYGGMGDGVMMRMPGSMGCQLRVRDERSAGRAMLPILQRPVVEVTLFMGRYRSDAAFTVACGLNCRSTTSSIFCSVSSPPLMYSCTTPFWSMKTLTGNPNTPN